MRICDRLLRITGLRLGERNLLSRLTRPCILIWCHRLCNSDLAGLVHSLWPWHSRCNRYG